MFFGSELHRGLTNRFTLYRDKMMILDNMFDIYDHWQIHEYSLELNAWNNIKKSNPEKGRLQRNGFIILEDNH